MDDLTTRVRDTQGLSLADIAADRSFAEHVDFVFEDGLAQTRFSSAL